MSNEEYFLWNDLSKQFFARQTKFLKGDERTAHKQAINIYKLGKEKRIEHSQKSGCAINICVENKHYNYECRKYLTEVRCTRALLFWTLITVFNDQ